MSVVEGIGGENGLVKVGEKGLPLGTGDWVFQSPHFFVMKVQVFDGVDGELQEKQVSIANEDQVLLRAMQELVGGIDGASNHEGQSNHGPYELGSGIPHKLVKVDPENGQDHWRHQTRYDARSHRPGTLVDLAAEFLMGWVVDRDEKGHNIVEDEERSDQKHIMGPECQDQAQTLLDQKCIVPDGVLL